VTGQRSAAVSVMPLEHKDRQTDRQIDIRMTAWILFAAETVVAVMPSPSGAAYMRIGDKDRCTKAMSNTTTAFPLFY